jgi:serine O-acetyltransferase
VLIEGFGRDSLQRYLSRQLAQVVPDDHDNQPAIAAHLDEALVRLGRCIDAVRAWQQGHFDPLHSTQYCQFLYYLSNTIWRRSGERGVATRLFLLNKALNSIDCFYEIELPEVFFIGHSVGIVLAKASYGERLVLYQNSTVGKNHGIAPVLEDGVVLHPNCAVIGRSRVRAGSVLAQGCSVINRDTPGNSLVFNRGDGSLVFKPLRSAVLGEVFRD